MATTAAATARRTSAVPDESLPAASSASAMRQRVLARSPGSRSARGRIALYVEPEALGDDALRIAHDRYYFVFYRYVFAYDASGTPALEQACSRTTRSRARRCAAGLALALENGELLLLSRGQRRGRRAPQQVGASLGAASSAASRDRCAGAQPPAANPPTSRCATG